MNHDVYDNNCILIYIRAANIHITYLWQTYLPTSCSVGCSLSSGCCWAPLLSRNPLRNQKKTNEHWHFNCCCIIIFWYCTNCAFPNFEWVFPSIIWVGAELMQIAMQRTSPAWPAKTKLRMTLDCSRIAKEITMMRGLFVKGRRQTLLYSCKRQE